MGVSIGSLKYKVTADISDYNSKMSKLKAMRNSATAEEKKRLDIEIKALKNVQKKEQQILKQRQKAYSNFVNNVRTSMKWFSVGLGAILTAGLVEYKNMESEMMNINSMLNNLGLTIRDFKFDFGELANTINEVTGASKESILNIAGLGLQYGVVKERIDEYSKAIVGLATISGRSAEQLQRQLHDAFNKNDFSVFEKIGLKIDATKNKHEQLNSVIKQSIDMYNNLDKSSEKTLSRNLLSLSNSLGAILEPIGERINEILITPFTNAIKENETTIINSINNIVQFISENVSTIIEIITSAILATSERVKNVCSEWGTKFKDSFNSAFEPIRKIRADSTELIKNYTQSLNKLTLLIKELKSAGEITEEQLKEFTKLQTEQVQIQREFFQKQDEYNNSLKATTIISQTFLKLWNGLKSAVSGTFNFLQKGTSAVAIKLKEWVNTTNKFKKTLEFANINTGKLLIGLKSAVVATAGIAMNMATALVSTTLMMAKFTLITTLLYPVVWLVEKLVLKLFDWVQKFETIRNIINWFKKTLGSNDSNLQTLEDKSKPSKDNSNLSKDDDVIIKNNDALSEQKERLDKINDSVNRVKEAEEELLKTRQKISEHTSDDIKKRNILYTSIKAVRKEQEKIREILDSLKTENAKDNEELEDIISRRVDLNNKLADAIKKESSLTTELNDVKKRIYDTEQKITEEKEKQRKEEEKKRQQEAIALAEKRKELQMQLKVADALSSGNSALAKNLEYAKQVKDIQLQYKLTTEQAIKVVEKLNAVNEKKNKDISPTGRKLSKSEIRKRDKARKLLEDDEKVRGMSDAERKKAGMRVALSDNAREKYERYARGEFTKEDKLRKPNAKEIDKLFNTPTSIASNAIKTGVTPVISSDISTKNTVQQAQQSDVNKKLDLSQVTSVLLEIKDSITVFTNDFKTTFA